MHHGKARFIVGFLILPVGLYALFVLWPYVQAFYISLTDWQGYSPTKNFVGLTNFVTLVHDPLFWGALKNNAYLLVTLPIVTIGLALFCAAMISFGGTGKRVHRGAGVRGVFGAGFYLVVYFFPIVMSAAMIGVLWLFIYEPRSGLLNSFLSLVGLGSARQEWLGQTNTALSSVAAIAVWGGVGFFVVLFTAAMTAIPHNLFEAMLLDGADQLQTFWHLTLPLSRDVVQVAVVFMGMGALDTFAVVNIVTVGPGGPDHSTNVIALHLYNSAFINGRFGYAAAIGVALFVITMAFTIATFRLTRREKIEY